MKIFGIEVSRRSILLSQVHNLVEIVTMIYWLKLALGGRAGAAVVVLVVGLTVEHLLALAVGKIA